MRFARSAVSARLAGVICILVTVPLLVCRSPSTHDPAGTRTNATSTTFGVAPDPVYWWLDAQHCEEWVREKTRVAMRRSFDRTRFYGRLTINDDLLSLARACRDAHARLCSAITESLQRISRLEYSSDGERQYVLRRTAKKYAEAAEVFAGYEKELRRVLWNAQSAELIVSQLVAGAERNIDASKARYAFEVGFDRMMDIVFDGQSPHEGDLIETSPNDLTDEE